MDYFLDKSGVSIHARIQIKDVRQPFIVFLHDSLGCAEIWKDFPETIGNATGLNTMVYDRQGYGNSDPFSEVSRDKQYLEREADVLYELIDQMELQRVLLFGHSDGGSIALIAAAKYPETVRGVITEGAHVFVEEETLAGIRQAAHEFETTDLKQKLSKYHGEKTQEVFDAWTQTWLSDDFRDWNIEHFLSKIQCPALIIQGADDEYGTAHQVERIVAQTSGKSEALIIPSVGHTPHKQAFEPVLKSTTKFIRSICPHSGLAVTFR